MSAAFAQGPARGLTAESANIYAGAGGSLSAASGDGMAATVANFLATKGHGAATLASLVPTATHVDPKSGVSHLKFGQEVAGLGVYGTYVKAAFDGDGNLIHLIENLAELSGKGVVPATAAPRDALNEAMLRNHPGVIVGLVEGNRTGNVVRFSGGGFFHRDPTVTRVAIAMENGSIRAGFLVETWTNRGNMLHHTLVGGSGSVLGVELRTNNDSYNIFPDHPGNSSQTVEAGPGACDLPTLLLPCLEGSPIGWLSGDQTTVNIGGNNANAYLDTEANNSPDSGGTSVTNGHFLTSAVLTDEPSTTQNQAVAVQNLFYFNNVIHDKLYGHGFTETAGNFQEDNFDIGGAGSDSVNAEAQDGSGTDNANFSTPSDGSSPRMQMFLWTGFVVEVGVDSYLAEGAEFGPGLTTTGITNTVVAAIDGTDITTDACEALTNAAEFTGKDKIALIDRGDCAFVTKVKNAQNAGAIGVIIANNVPGGIFTMGGSDPTIDIPSVFIGQSDGGAIRAVVPVTVTATIRATLMRDGDLDSDIIWHEYGHGLTWRMIGNMSGDLSGAIGEGMSDVLAILINGNDVVGEYSNNDPIGIRSAPYTGYLRTYGDMGGSSVHFDGEIYAATIWRLWELFDPAIDQGTLFDYLIGGMNFTPAGPAMEDMRDGILEAVLVLADPSDVNAHQCLIWDAFAVFGIGVGAEGIARGGGPFGASLKSVTESFKLPPECTGDNAQPVLEINAGLTVANDAVGAITSSLLLVTDADNSPAEIVYTVTTVPMYGDLFLGVSQVTVNGTFTQADIDGVLVSYDHDGGATTVDSFQFTVSDGAGGSIGATTFEITVTGGEPPPPPPPGSGMHIGDLDETLTTSEGSTWSTTVVITVHDSGEGALAGAVVSVGWTGSGPSLTECTTVITDGLGQCSVWHSGIHGKKTTLTVNNITLAGHTYDATANHDEVDADGSDGTAITVSKP